jgi:hypothetical protein
LIFLGRKAKKTPTTRRKYLPKKKKMRKRTSPSALSQEERLLLTRLLEDAKTIDPSALSERIPGPQMAEALAQSLPLDEPRTPDLLSGIRKAFPEKTVQKAVRKTFFRLRQRGISGPESEPEETPAFAAVQKEEPSAYVGPIDGAGNRPLLIAIPRGASGVDLAMGLVDDEHGIREFAYSRYSRKRMKELKDIFFSKVPHMVATTLSHAATVLEFAYQNGEGKTSDPDGEYLRLRPWLLENIELLDRPAVADLIPLHSVTADMMTPSQLDRLFQHELMNSWTLDPEKLEPLSEEVMRAQESPIFISEAQRREHMNKIKEESITKLFGEKERLIFRRRLEEMAFVFFKIGEEALARLSLAAALSIEEKASLLKVNPFLNILVDRSLAKIQKPARSSPLILR